MQLKKGDYVKLNDKWGFADMDESPKWGGKFGYIDGVVDKVHTGDHNPSAHFAAVKWANGKEGRFPEYVLSVLSNDERDVAADYRTMVLPSRDVWCLIKTNAGNFALNVIECNPLGVKRVHGSRFVAGVTRMVLPSIDNSDYNLTAMILSQPDWTEMRTNTIWDAASSIYTTWDLPEFDILPMPLPEFDSIREAADTAPKGDIGALFFFHLPRNLVDYCDESSGCS